MTACVTIVSDVEDLVRACPDEQVQVLCVQQTLSGYIAQCLRADLIILDETGRHLFIACILRRFCRFKLLCVDPVLPNPRDNFQGRLKARIRRRLLAAVDGFVLYFRNTEGYEQHYGIDSKRIRYVPFKANVMPAPARAGNGGFVLCAGRSRRDIATFVHAMALNGLPAVVVQQPAALVASHGTPAWSKALPPNVRLIVDEDDALSGLLQNATIVVIPRFKGDINATGISMYLSAMAYGKCVVISRGPGADDVLTGGQAVFVEPEDPEQLAGTVQALFNDADLRNGFAVRGRDYAESLGGGNRLTRDLLQAGLHLLTTPARAGQQVEPVR